MDSDNPEKEKGYRVSKVLKKPLLMFKIATSNSGETKSSMRMKNLKPAPREVLPGRFDSQENFNTSETDIQFKTSQRT